MFKKQENQREDFEKHSNSNMSFENEPEAKDKNYNELSAYLFTDSKVTLAKSAKKTLMNSKNVIESTLKDTIDDFEKKLEKLEAELDSGFIKNDDIIELLAHREFNANGNKSSSSP